MTDKHEVLISVDVETSGPIPGEYSLLTLGACCIDNPTLTFECELKPTTTKFDPKALEITGLSLERLKNEGVAPEDAMRLFKEWVVGVIGEDSTPVFVGFNAPFDWSFINYYFHRYLGENPFGFSALDIKSMYLGATGCSWTETRSSLVAKVLKPKLQGDHDALHDAMYQAELFRLTRLLMDRQKS